MVDQFELDQFKLEVIVLQKVENSSRGRPKERNCCEPTGKINGVTNLKILTNEQRDSEKIHA